MKRRIVIAGAGGFGRGVYGWLMESLEARNIIHTTDVVFIDDGAPLVHPPGQVVDTITAYQPQPRDEVICAVGNPELRQLIVDSLREKGTVFRSFVDDRASIGSRVRIGEGAVVCPGTVISADAEVGAHVHINFNCSVGHDAVLSNYVTLSPAVNVMGEVAVGEGAFLGGSAVVLPRTTVGAWSTAGAGAVLVNGNDPRSVMIGNPARANRAENGGR